MSRTQRGGHNFMEYADTPFRGTLIIPQEIYPAPQPYTQLPNVRFTVKGILGIRLVDALDPAYNELDDGNLVPRLAELAKKTTVRLKWPGYSSWSEVLHVYDHTYNVNPYTTKKVAQLVAQRIQMFCRDLISQPYNESSGVDGWQLERYPFERLVLLELRHVSQGSWQPVLAVL